MIWTRTKTAISLQIVFALLFWISCGGSSAPAPTVTSTTASGKVLTTAAISVTFSTAVDQASVESAFSITGSDPVSGTFAWADNTLTFTPDALWKTHHPYTLTIGTGALDLEGTPFAEAFTQAFTPQLNLHDVNGDGIDDFLLGAPGHDTGSYDNSGAAYLFLGKASFSDVDLATQSADATFTIEGGDAGIGFDAKVVGDINGDGYADMVIGAPPADITGSYRGFVIIVFGSATPSGATITQANPDVVDGALIGPSDDSWLGFTIAPAGDVNGDGLADVLIGGRLAPSDSRAWLVLGRTSSFPALSSFTPITNITNAVYDLTGNFLLSGVPMAACDVNGDELDDLVLGSAKANGSGLEKGQVYVVLGSEAPTNIDLRSQAADATITGASDKDALGMAVACADVNGDGYGDILAGAPRYGVGYGRTYLISGGATLSDMDLASDSTMATFTGAGQYSQFGITGCIPGDVDGNGFNDMLAGAPFARESLTDDIRGRAYLFAGSSAPASVDLSAGESPLASFVGEIPPATNASAFGYCKAVGDVDADGFDDLILGAPTSPDNLFKGQVYLIRGSATPSSIDIETQSPDATFTGAADDDYLMPSPAAL